jgi:hypothetical protein
MTLPRSDNWLHGHQGCSRAGRLRVTAQGPEAGAYRSGLRENDSSDWVDGADCNDELGCSKLANYTYSDNRRRRFAY